jgi:hypothetical protein
VTQISDFIEGIIIFLTAGGGIAAGLTIANNWLMKRRQHKVNMSNIRMQTISKAAPLYNKIALYNAWNLSHQLTLPNDQQNTELMFYYACNILNLRRQIVNTIGDLQFTDLTAETIIGDLGRNITGSIARDFGPIDLSIMTSLVDDDLPFHRFHQIILEDHAALFHKFEQWIARRDIAEELERNCRWYSQLIMYELNYVYMIWYGEPPNMLALNADLLTHLQQEHPAYLRRLLKIETGSWL